MTQIQVTRRDVQWSYANLVGSNAINLLMLPLLLWALGPAELGLWYAFASLGAVATVMDLGLAVTFTRNVSMAWCGAARVQATGIEVVPGDTPPNMSLVESLLKASRLIYMLIGLVVLVLVVPLGTWHVFATASGMGWQSVYAWPVFVVAMLLNVVLSYWTPFLKGVGAVADSQRALLLGKSSQLLVTTALLLCGLGLLGVSLGFLTSSIVTRVLSIHWFRRRCHQVRSTRQDPDDFPSTLSIVKTVWPTTWRQGVASLAQYLYAAAPVLLASIFFGLATAGAVGLTYQIVGLLKVLGNGLFNAYVPTFTRLRVQGDPEALARRFALSLGVTGFIILVGAAMAFSALPFALILLGSDLELLEVQVVVVLVVSEWLINQAALCTGLIATGNRVPMAASFAVTTLLSISASVIAVTVFGLGPLGLVLPGALLWLAYNDWIWFRRAAHELNRRPTQLAWLTCAEPLRVMASSVVRRG